MYTCNNGGISEYLLVSDKYQNDGFELNLPATVPEKYLCDIADMLKYLGCYHFEGTISDTKAKIGFLEIGAYNSNGKQRIGWFGMEDEETDVYNYRKGSASYWYVDKDVTIKGHRYPYYDGFATDEYDDCYLQKGWNIVYDTHKELPLDEYLVSTKKPSNLNLKWCYEGLW